MKKEFEWEITLFTCVCGLVSVLSRGSFFGTKTRVLEVMRQEKKARQLTERLPVHGKVEFVK